MNTRDGGDIHRFESCIAHVLAVLELPLTWSGHSTAHVLSTLADALVKLLHLSFVYARLNARTGQNACEILRHENVRPSSFDFHTLGTVFLPWLSGDHAPVAGVISDPFGPGKIAIMSVGFGSGERIGTLIAAAHREGFPDALECLVLRVAASQVCVVLHEQLLTGAQQAARQAQEELAYATRVLGMGELTISIAHEINQPLAAIVANSNAGRRWIDRELPDIAQAKSSLEKITRDAHRASEIIQRIRAFATKATPSRGPVNVNEAIHEVLVITAHEMSRDQVLLQVHLAEKLPAVSADRVELQQVVLNLIMNSIEAMRPVTERPRILQITSEEHAPAMVEVSVGDNGIGVAPGNLSRLFEPLFTTKPRGMGLGLSISRRIVEAHGGKLRALVNPDHGLTLSFTLPVL